MFQTTRFEVNPPRVKGEPLGVTSPEVCVCVLGERTNMASSGEVTAGGGTLARLEAGTIFGPPTSARWNRSCCEGESGEETCPQTTPCRGAAITSGTQCVHTQGRTSVQCAIVDSMLRGLGALHRAAHAPCVPLKQVRRGEGRGRGNNKSVQHQAPKLVFGGGRPSLPAIPRPGDLP
ncbi:Hypp7088 [Branchiostoma lanceolatum]|uniref:Hypp7088 protein n=1 Tax=Branchiostoma lanceolatum TaxID=7740 RepID=A0A8K0EBM7_BRALA|nr:Hypp7088 [Branchiostoma lanceolatum]